MKVKAFHIRLSKENSESDQETLNSFMESVAIKKTTAKLINGQPHFWSILVFYDEHTTQKIEKKSEKVAVKDFSELTYDEKKIFEVFKQWRQDKATEMNVPNFIICHNTELMTIAKLKPQTLKELLEIKGFGEQKVAKFGDDILALLNSI